MLRFYVRVLPCLTLQFNRIRDVCERVCPGKFYRCTFFYRLAVISGLQSSGLADNGAGVTTGNRDLSTVFLWATVYLYLCDKSSELHCSCYGTDHPVTGIKKVCCLTKNNGFRLLKKSRLQTQRITVFFFKFKALYFYRSCPLHCKPHLSLTFYLSL